MLDINLKQVQRAETLIGQANCIIEADSYHRSLLIDGKLNKRLNVS